MKKSQLQKEKKDDKLFFNTKKNVSKRLTAPRKKKNRIRVSSLFFLGVVPEKRTEST